MLLNFKCKNFKSFKDGFELEMQLVKKLTELSYSILHEKYGENELKALPTSVIYGANASGKTSVINAISCFKQIVMSGSIENAPDDSNRDHVSRHKELIPFIYDKNDVPTSLEITFITDSRKVCYSVSFIINKDGSRRFIVEEKLTINDSLVFRRGKDSIDELDVSAVKDLLNKGYNIKDTEKHRIFIENNLNQVRLFLTTDFYSFCSKKIVEMIHSYFNDRLIIVNSIDKALKDMPIMENTDIESIAESAGILANGFAYRIDNESPRPKLVSILSKKNGKFTYINSDLIESMGTLHLISIMPLIINALKNGSVLFLDELDSSLHPNAVINILSMFHNDELNLKNTQLIFNTHNPIYLKNRVLRRDEIKFVERNRETKSSSLYSLSDFKANGEASVRKTTDYMKNYFANRYGAIENVDFTDIVQKIISRKNEKVRA